MKFNQSQISEIIQMAWDDQTDFSHIKKIYEIDEGDVKKIMKKKWKILQINLYLFVLSSDSIKYFVCVPTPDGAIGWSEITRTLIFSLI